MVSKLFILVLLTFFNMEAFARMKSVNLAQVLQASERETAQLREKYQRIGDSERRDRNRRQTQKRDVIEIKKRAIIIE